MRCCLPEATIGEELDDKGILAYRCLVSRVDSHSGQSHSLCASCIAYSGNNELSTFVEVDLCLQKSKRKSSAQMVGHGSLLSETGT